MSYKVVVELDKRVELVSRTVADKAEAVEIAMNVARHGMVVDFTMLTIRSVKIMTDPAPPSS